MSAPTLRAPVRERAPVRPDLRAATRRPRRRRQWVIGGLVAALVAAFAVRVLLGD